MENILVTGGLGYIGSHTVIKLHESGYNPIILDNLSASQASTLDSLNEICSKDIKFIKNDLKEHASLMKYIDTINIDGIIHFAAYKSVEESVSDPIKYYDNNIGSLISLLKACSIKNIKKIILSSSCTVYGQPKECPVNEQAFALNAESPYGSTKVFSEKILSDYVHSHGAKALSLRYFNPIGAHPSGKVGEQTKGLRRNLVPLLCDAALKRIPEFYVYGNDYNTIDGTAIRDYIDVNDLAEAHVKSLSFLSKTDCNYDIFNIGSGSGFTVLEVIKSFEEVNNIKINFEFKNRRPGDVERVFADTQKSLDILGFKPQISLKASLETALNWEMKCLRS